jgi:hypothetical protein
MKQGMVRLGIWIAVGIALVLVFAAYLRPEMAFALANQLWNCF